MNQNETTEREILLSISNAIAGVKDRNSLLKVINDNLRNLFYFTHTATLQFDKNRQFMKAFLLDPNSVSKSDPDYDQIVSRPIPVQDGIYNVLFEANTPVVFDIAKKAAATDVPDYVRMTHKAGLKEFMVVALRTADEKPIGAISFYSDKTDSFGSNIVALIHGIACHISTAMENILYHEELLMLGREKEILFEIGNLMVAVKDKDDFINLINTGLKKYIPYDENNVLVYNKQTESYKIFSFGVLPKRFSDSRFHEMTRVEYPDLNSQRVTHYPELIEVKNLVDEGSDWGKAIYEMGVRQLVHLKLLDGSETLGQLVLLSEHENVFTPEHLSLLKNISFNLAKALANILASEEIRIRNDEKSVLLSLGKHLAQTRNKIDLQEVMHLELKKLFYFSHSTIILLSKDKKSYENFVDATGEVPAKNHPKNTFQASIDFNLCSILDNNKPLFIDLDKLVKTDSLPEVLQFQHSIGTREMVSVGLKNEKEVFGILNFYSDRPNNFKDNHLDIIQGVAHQIAIAVANIIANENLEKKEKDTKILLSLSADIDKVKNRKDLLLIIKHKLKELLSFTDIAITLYNSENQTFKVFAHHLTDKREQHPEFKNVIIPEYAVHDGIHDVALGHDEPVIIAIEDAVSNPGKHEGTQFIYEMGIKKMLLVKLTSNNDVIGFLNILSESETAFEEINLTILKGITDQLSTAISTVLSLEEITRRDRENEILLSISNALSSTRNKRDLMASIKQPLKSTLTFSDMCVAWYDIKKGLYSIFARDNEKTVQHPDFERVVSVMFPINDGLHNVVMESEYPVVFSYGMLANMKMPHIEFIINAGIREVASVRLRYNNEIIGALVLLSEEDNSFSQDDKNLLEKLSHHLATAVSNIIANEKIEQQLEEISRYKQQLEDENLYLQQEASSGYSYNDIIGASAGMQQVFHLLSHVSFTNSTVLLLGETGTGKELIARAIHNSSSRKNKLMVKVNCAALPANLIESELFGHERGSFTGATERRLGKFELANHGTLFLDEIGEMPLDLQVKLLRALQEREIERVGGKGTIKIDLRIIAATNRNLQKEVNEGRFRSDLYYRLNVFPITLPPLREHKEDIPTLVSHFIEKYAKNNGKKISQISSQAMKELMAYNWPGNVRELEHLIERSILMSTGPVIRDMHLPKLKSGENRSPQTDGYFKTHEEHERDYIIEVLNKCNGKIFGPGGAAEILDIKVGTLNSKIKKLGIKKEQIFIQKP